MNKKGFTLTELLAVVVIIALLSTLAVPNIISMLEKSKKEKFVTDAKQVIAKAKYYYKNNKKTDITLDDLKIDLGKSPFKNNCEEGNEEECNYKAGKVKVINTSGDLTYSIYLTDGIYCIGSEKDGTTTYIDEAELKDSVQKCS